MVEGRSGDGDQSKIYVSDWEKSKRASVQAMSLEQCVKRFFEILDTKEETDSGREFKPVVWDPEELAFRSCRVLKGIEMGFIFDRMKELIR
jgi:hypothetical protein